MPEAAPPPDTSSLLIWIAILVAIALIVVLIWWTLKSASRAAAKLRAAETGGTAPATQQASPLRKVGVVVSFARAIRFLKGHAAGRDYRYEVPWILMIGGAGAGASTALANAGACAPLDREGGPTFGQANGVEWWFYQRGLVLNPPSDMVLRADGLTSDEQGFDLLLKQLVRKGARRPLDGVVLTISAEDLLNSSRRAEIIGKAAVIRHKLSEIRKRLSMRLPVYVLVTKCDHLRGFSAFAAVLQPVNGNMFGWSNPYPFDAAFLPEWVNQGFEELRPVIAEQQMDIFVEQKDVHDPDGVFLFPGEFQTLREPLSTYLTQAFQDNAYEESFFFRGFYFTGDATQQAESEPSSGDAGEDLAPAAGTSILHRLGKPVNDRQPHPVFLHELFDLKIFPESRLAKPLSRVDMSRNRTVMLARVLALLFVLIAGIGTLSACLRLYSLKTNHLSPLFNALIGAMEKTTATEKVTRSKGFKEAASNVLGSMALLSSKGFRSVFIPASWDGSIDKEIQDGLARAFQVIVLQDIRWELIQHLSGSGGILQSTTPRMSAVADADTLYETPEDVPEYPAWNKFVADLTVLEENIARYNRICRANSGNSGDFRGLVKYLELEADLPEDFNFNNPYFDRILNLANADQFGTPDRAATLDHAKLLIADFFSHWYSKNNRIVDDVEHMVLEIEAFSGPPAGINYQDLKNLSDAITTASADLGSPAFDWVSRNQFRKAAFPNFIAPVQALAYLKDLDAETLVEQDGRAAFEALKEELRAKSPRLTGPVLDFDRDPVAVSSSVSTLQANLTYLLGQPFVQREPGTPQVQFNVTRVLWDKASLLEAQKLFDSYDRFERGSLRSMPRNMRDVLRRIALDRLERNVLDLVGQAQVPVQAPATEIDKELEHFTESLDVLQQLLAGFAKLPDTSLSRQLNTTLVNQASAMLSVLGAQLQEDNPYGVKGADFDWWEGEKPLSQAAYEVRSEDALKDYLDRQRDEVDTLAHRAEPLVRFLEPRITGRQNLQTAAGWRAVLNELKKRNDKKPGNSVTLLEDFVLTGLDKISPDTSCQDPAREPQSHADLFLDRRSTLRAQAVARCRILSQRAYINQISEQFNNRLAGRFPFSSTVMTAPQNAAPEADPAALAEFLNRVDQYGKIALDSLKQSPQYGKSRDEAVGFLSQIAQIRPIFTPFLTGFEKDPAPSFDFTVAFRVNPVRAIDANQVADWGLDVGQQSFRYRGKETSGHWRLGDPMRVTLRFAADSPLIPVADPRQPDMVVNKRIVTFEYTDAWSLFRLLATHQANRGEIDLQAQKPHLLSFYIPTVPDKTLPQPQDGSVGGLVRVYVQLTVLPPGAKEGANVPLPFPDRAPKLTLSGTGDNQ